MKEKWTSESIPELNGKVMIVTGGNSGLGFESVKAFAGNGAHVILASRSVEKGEKAKAEMGETSGQIEVMQLDLGELASVKAFADEFNAKYDRLDVLLNNAGIMMTPYFKTKDGLEGQTGTNHFGHFALTAQLFERLKQTPNSRIVNVSSTGHRSGNMDFDNLMFENGNGYSRMKSYGRSKLENLLFTYELQRRLEQAGIDTIALASHPGGTKTNLDRHLRGKWWFKILAPIVMSFAMKQDQGALSQIRASVDPDVKGGEYYGPHKGMSGYPILVKSSDDSHNVQDAKKLWDVSEELTGVSFNF
jgi:NAD(P)-dependent dehydrogenase (short-subunit alcohol dehydrogenase family)